jgi:hypothetical protein
VKSVRTALALVVLCTPALALDGDPPKPAPAPAPAPGDGKPAAKAPPAPAAKKERKVDADAEAALKKYVSLVHYPVAAGIKEMSAVGEIEANGMRLGVNPSWSADKGFDMELVPPDAVKEKMAAMGKSAEEAMKGQKRQLNLFLGISSAFEAPGRDWSHFDVSFKKQGDDSVVELTAFDDQADAESRSYTFGKDGLLKSSSFAPKMDPDDPQAAMMAGMSLDMTWEFEKKGEKSLLSTRTLSIMGQELPVKFAYWDGPGGSYLPKTLTLSTPQGEQVFRFHDYTVDGKFVESTKAEAPKPEAPKEKKADGEKPADKPAGDPPAPVPAPAPKDAPK